MIKLVIGAVFFFACFSAGATCVQSEAAGTWRVYSISLTSGEAWWTRCNVFVTSTGVVRTKSFCYDHTGEKFYASGGRVNLAQGCRLYGYLDGAGVRNRLVDGQMDRDKLTFSGVGRFPGGIFLYNGVKR